MEPDIPMRETVLWIDGPVDCWVKIIESTDAFFVGLQVQLADDWILGSVGPRVMLV
jgi:hypothetical protein